MTSKLSSLVILGIGLAISLPTSAQTEITIATHAEGSAYHKIATSITELLAESSDRKGVITPFKRWTEYLPVINNGEIDIGFVTGIDAGTRYRDDPPRALNKIRAVARLWALRYTYLGRAAFGMKNYVGFRGQRIGLDRP